MQTWLKENPNEYDNKTWYENNRIAEKHIIPLLGYISLNNLGNRHIEHYKNMKLAGTQLNGEGILKTVTINKYLALMSSALKKAVTIGYVSYNPMRLVNYLSKMKRDGTTNHAKDNCLSIRDQDLFMKKLYAVYSLRGANKFHTNDELIRITLNHFNLNVKHFADQESTNSKEILGKILEPFGFTKEEINSPKFLFKFEIAKLFPIVYLAFSTGMRLSELLALEWSDIDFEEKIIHVCKSSKYSNKANHSQTSGHFLSGTKNKENRTLDITKDDVEFLKKHKVYQTEHRFNYEKRINNNYYDNNLVFAKKNGTYLRNDTVSDVFSTFAKRLGSNVTFHSTRHFHITLLLTIGVPVVKVAERVGHKKASVTSDTYVHVKKGYQTNLGESYHNALKKTNGIAEEQLSKAQEIASKLMLENDDFN